MEEFVISSNKLKSARVAVAACSSLVSSATTILSNVVSLISALIFSAIVIVSFVNTFPDDGMTGTWNVKSLFEMDYFFTLISSPNVLPRKIQNTHSFLNKKMGYMNVTLGSNNNILESLKGGSVYGKVHSLRAL